MPRGTCAELIALRCAVSVLAMSRFDQQYGRNLLNEKRKGPRRRTLNEDGKTTGTHVHTGTWYSA